MAWSARWIFHFWGLRDPNGDAPILCLKTCGFDPDSIFCDGETNQPDAANGCLVTSLVDPIERQKPTNLVPARENSELREGNHVQGVITA